MKILKSQLRKIIKEEKQKVLQEDLSRTDRLPLILEAINNGTATATMGLGLGRDEILIKYGKEYGESLVLKVRDF